jgi:hypothetical protein
MDPIMADAAADMSAADTPATADHAADLVALLAAGKRCLVCAPAVPQDEVHGGSMKAPERAGIGLLTKQGGYYVFKQARKLRGVDRHTFGHDVREVGHSDLVAFQLLEVLEPVPGPPEALRLRDADILAVAVGLIQPVIDVKGEEVPSALGGAANQRPPGLLSGLTSAGQLSRDGFWQGVAALITWEGAATLDPPVVPSGPDRGDCALRKALRHRWQYAVKCDASDCKLATANAVAVYVDELLADAVARCHPRKIDPTLPAATGDWLRVADHLQASLSDIGIESGIRQRLLDLVRKSELSNQKHLKWKSVKCEAGSFETPNSRKAFAVVCERRWGVPGDEAVDAAMDSAEPRAALIELLVQHQMPLTRAASEIDEVSLQLRQELQGVELTALRQRAASTTGNRRSVGLLCRKSVQPITNANKLKLTASHQRQLCAFKKSPGRYNEPDSTRWYEMPAEYPLLVPDAVTHDERLHAFKRFSTAVGTTRAWQRHVCAVCDLGKWESEMHARPLEMHALPFTVESLEQAVHGVPVPGVEWSWETPFSNEQRSERCKHGVRYLTSVDREIALRLGWTESTWCGKCPLDEKLRKWLSGRVPTRGTQERAFTDKVGLSDDGDSWRDRAYRLRAGDGAYTVDQLRTRQDGRPGGATFCGFQLQANAVETECRLLLDNYVDEQTMAAQCRFNICKDCHSGLCAGKKATVPKDAIANRNNYGINLWQRYACARPGQTNRSQGRTDSPAVVQFERTTRAVYYDAAAMDDLETALLALPHLRAVQDWAKWDGLTLADDTDIATTETLVAAILHALKHNWDKGAIKPPGAVGRGCVQNLLEMLSAVEERLVAGVWSNASYRMAWCYTKCARIHRETALSGHIVCTPQSSGPTLADGRPVALESLPESFAIVFVGAEYMLADLQKQLQARAKAKLPEDHTLPIVRRSVVKDYLAFQWHYRLRGRGSHFAAAMTDPTWQDYFAKLPSASIPMSLMQYATWAPEASARQEAARAAGYAPDESAQAVSCRATARTRSAGGDQRR